MRGNSIPGGCSNVVAPTALVHELGGFDERLSMLADWDLWIRLARSGPAARCEQPHVAYLDHGASMHVQQADLAPAELAYLADKHPELVEESATPGSGAWFMLWTAAGQYRAGRRWRATATYLRTAVRYRSEGALLRALAAPFTDRYVRRDAIEQSLRPLRRPPAWLAAATPGTAPAAEPPAWRAPAVLAMAGWALAGVTGHVRAGGALERRLVGDLGMRRPTRRCCWTAPAAGSAGAPTRGERWPRRSPPMRSPGACCRRTSAAGDHAARREPARHPGRRPRLRRPAGHPGRAARDARHAAAMSDRTADVVVVGAGVCGLLVASECRRGRRGRDRRGGARRSHAEQLRTGEHAGPGAQPNDEIHPNARPYPWNYVYGVGGSTLAWAGVTPRFAKDDFRLHTAYGVGRDWPFGLDELAPYYEAAELALGVAGPTAPAAAPARPRRRADRPAPRALRAAPAGAPERRIGPRPPCTGGATCELCPSDARYTACNAPRPRPHLPARRHAARAHGGLARAARQAAARPAWRRSAPTGSACGRGRAVVLAANGLENAGLLLRSQLDGPDVGAGCSTTSTACSSSSSTCPRATVAARRPRRALARYAGGPHRASAATSALPVTPGLHIAAALADGMAHGLRGPRLRAHVTERDERTPPLDTVGEDLRARTATWSSRPTVTRTGCRGTASTTRPTRTIWSARTRSGADVVRRLAPLGARLARSPPAAGGAHALGTCRMGEADGWSTRTCATTRWRGCTWPAARRSRSTGPRTRH